MEFLSFLVQLIPIILSILFIAGYFYFVYEVTPNIKKISNIMSLKLYLEYKDNARDLAFIRETFNKDINRVEYFEEQYKKISESNIAESNKDILDYEGIVQKLKILEYQNKKLQEQNAEIVKMISSNGRKEL